MRPTNAATLACVALALLAGCDGDSGTTPETPGTPGITIVSGSGVTDSVQAILPPLVIELRDEAGYLLRNTDVQFEASVVPISNAPFRIPRLYIRTDRPYADVAQGFTDANGRLALHVAMGAVPGPATITIAALPRQIYAQAHYQVLPGAPDRLEVGPRDTTIHTTATFNARAVARDRWGNATPATITLTPRAPVVSVSSGTWVRGESVGRTYVVVQAGTLVDSIGVSVVQ